MIPRKSINKKTFLSCHIIIYNLLQLSFCEQFYDLMKIENDTVTTSTCILGILEQHFPCNTYITLVTDDEDDKNLIGNINERKCFSVIVRTYHKKGWFIYNNVYLIMTTNIDNLKASMLQLKSETFWNPKARFIFTTQNCSDTEINNIFHLFLTYKIYDVIFLVQAKRATYVYTYFPFEDGRCGDNTAPVKIGNCKDAVNNTVYFQTKGIKHFRKCKFRVIKFADQNILPILEQYILDDFAIKANFTLTYEKLETEKNFGVVLPNGTTTGLLGYLDRNEADIAMGSAVLFKNRADLYDFISGFHFASFNLYSSAVGDERWKTVYMAFDVETWLLIIFFYFIMISMCIVLLNLSPKISYNHSYIFLHLYGYFLGNGTVLFFKTKRLRTIMISWIWFTFLTSSFYNSDMYSLVTDHMTYKRQISHDKLNTVPYKPCISYVISTFFFFAYNEVMPENIDNPLCNTEDGSFNVVASGTNLYTVQLKSFYTSKEKEFLNIYGKRMLDSWDFTGDILFCFYIYKGFVLKDQLQMHALRMFDAGITTVYNNWLNPEQAIDNRKNKSFKQFVMKDLQIHFGVLFVGSMISTFVFLYEIYKKFKYA
ncbi:unnamed protein product [Diatraea saccharalis]|uniref:Uncharacterized protein n=1 Tax=Diatraea saccharalis TaxID=40085 RepID=A0A9P0FXG2_9NEOP|nr:unnamed protein product [Diatraea saccharalis]